MRVAVLFVIRGSSPCVWGQVDADFTVDLSDRIIPMRVGTSQEQSCHCTVKQDHPHACGDKYFLSAPLPLVSGSSPCVWGQVKYAIITPPCIRDHPHACGDKKYVWGASHEKLGSSPCVWGQVYLRSLHRDNAGIIPMRVGTRSLN